MEQRFFKARRPGERLLQNIAAAAVLISAILSALTFVGPYRWLVRLQLLVFGGYYAALSFVITLILLWLPCVVLIRAYSKARATTGKCDVPEHFANQTTQSAFERIECGAHWMLRWVFGNWSGYVAFVGLILVGIAGFEYMRTANAQHLCEMNIAELESGKEPDSVWLAVTGTPLLHGAVGIQGFPDIFYIPIASTQTPSGGVSIFAKVPQRAMTLGQIERTRRWEGIVEAERLPPIALLEHEKLGLRSATNYRVLSIGKNPARSRDRALGALKLGLVLLGGGGSVLALMLYRDTRRQHVAD